MKPLSQEFVESVFVERGCQLLGEYKNKSKPVLFKCRCGTNSTITYSSFKRGSYCMSCSGKNKHTLTEIRAEFTKRGCVLLADYYYNALTKMDAICKCGKSFQISWNNLQQGKLCKQCGVEKVAKQTRGENHYNWITDREEARLRRVVSARCRMHLHRALKRIGSPKEGKTYRLLGYTSLQLKEHIVNHKNWQSVKDLDWHLDHIFPVKAFNDYNIQDVQLINCLDNLEPVEGKQNLRKNGRYDKIAFETWLKTKGMVV